MIFIFLWTPLLVETVTGQKSWQ